MRTSFCSIGLKDENIRHIIPQVAEIGYEGIEIWGTHLDKFLAEGNSVNSLKHIIDKHGLVVPVISPAFNLTGTDEEREKSLAQGMRFIDHAEALGKPLIRVFTGNKGSAEATEDDWKRCAEVLQALCEEAQPRGIAFALETHPQNLMDNISATHQLLDLVNYPNLKIIYDAWHVFNEGQADPVKSVDDLWFWIAHVHAKNRDRKAKGPYGTDARHLDAGDMQWLPVLERLSRKGFPGFISIEWFGIDRSRVWEVAEYEFKYLQKFIEGETGKSVVKKR
jgi:sugar phosphate isomerase/epimerase